MPTQQKRATEGKHSIELTTDEVWRDCSPEKFATSSRRALRKAISKAGSRPISRGERRKALGASSV